MLGCHIPGEMYSDEMKQLIPGEMYNCVGFDGNTSLEELNSLEPYNLHVDEGDIVIFIEYIWSDFHKKHCFVFMHKLGFAYTIFITYSQHIISAKQQQ